MSSPVTGTEDETAEPYKPPTEASHLSFENQQGVISKPTYRGLVKTERDARLLVQACLTGRFYLIPPGAYCENTADMIQSGSVFVVREDYSGNRIWTDGKEWVGLGQRGSFELYRERFENNTLLRQILRVVEGASRILVVSYYTEQDLQSGLSVPSEDPELSGLKDMPGTLLPGLNLKGN